MITQRFQNTDFYDYFKANESKLMDQSFLEDFIRPRTTIKRMKMTGERPRMGQFAKEFAPFMLECAKAKCDSYIEIGTSTGGTFYCMDSYLRAAVPGYKGGTGVNIKMKARNWEAYKLKYPSTEMIIINSRKLELGDRQFGAAFIDANHSEEYVLSDFGKVRNNARICGFHDIVLKGATVDKAWKKIKDQYPKAFSEFIDLEIPDFARCGVGMIRLR